MYSEAWLTLALFVGLIGLVSGQTPLLLVALLLLAVLPVAGWWSRHALDNLEYVRRLSERRIFPDETVELEVRVRNHKYLPVSWLRLEDPFPAAAEVEGKDLAPSSMPLVAHLQHRTSLGPYEGIRWRYRMRVPARGVYFLGPVEARSGDVFGLFSQGRELNGADRLIVYPQVVSMERLGLPSKQPFGETVSRRPIYQDPSRPAGVRDYRPGDPFRHIHWKATARVQDLQVKVYDPTVSHTVVLVLNVATFARHWEGTDPELLEHGISVTASLAHHLSLSKASVGLVANGSWPRSDQPIRVLPGRHPGQLTRVLESLAAVSSFPTSSLEALLARQAPRLPYVGTLAVVTCVVSEPLRHELELLRQRGRPIALVYTGREPLADPPPELLVHHVPPEALGPLPQGGEGVRGELGGQRGQTRAGGGKGGQVPAPRLSGAPDRVSGGEGAPPPAG